METSHGGSTGGMHLQEAVSDLTFHSPDSLQFSLFLTSHSLKLIAV